MKANTLAAINKIAGAQSNDFEVTTSADSVTVKTFYTVSTEGEHSEPGRYIDATVSAQMLAPGVWMRAQWSEKNNQWQSGDFTKSFARANPSAVACFGRSCAEMIGNIRTYPSAAAAIRAFFEQRK